jgi:uncharacterized membrane protein YfcA
VMAVVVMALASTVQASVGFGANLLAAPVFAILDPDLVPGPIFIAAGVLNIATTIRERDDVDREVVRWATAGRIPGAILGALVLASATDRSIQLMVGISILVAVALSLGFVNIPERRASFFGGGAISGFGATTAAIGGPPVALILQHRSGPVLRATMGAFFALGTIITIPAIAAAGRLGRDELLIGAALVPGALLGFVISGPLRPHVDAGRLRPMVLGLAAIAAVILVARTV